MSCDIFPDLYGGITDWVRKGFGYENGWPGACLTFGFYYKGQLVGALVFHNLREHRDVWWTLYTVDKHWCTRRVLRKMFTMAFNIMGCQRISILVSKSNQQSLSVVKRMGFKEEGMLRRYRDNGEDCYILGMLKEECPWINNKGENYE